MNNPVLWAMIIGALSIVLGFIALLASRIYIDSATKATVEVDIPFFGKAKSNYPALMLVFLGAVLVAYGVKTSFDLQAKQADDLANTQWSISGHLASSDGKAVDWQRGVFTLFEGSPTVTYDPDGGFHITLMIKKGESLEQYLQRIDYTNFESGSVMIYPSQELDKYNKNDPSSLISNLTDSTRDYKPKRLTQWNSPP